MCEKNLKHSVSDVNARIWVPKSGFYAGPTLIVGIDTRFDLIYYNRRYDTPEKSYGRSNLKVRFIKCFVLLENVNSSPFLFLFTNSFWKNRIY